jgi:hypothetical protein
LTEGEHQRGRRSTIAHCRDARLKRDLCIPSGDPHVLGFVGRHITQAGRVPAVEEEVNMGVNKTGGEVARSAIDPGNGHAWLASDNIGNVGSVDEYRAIPADCTGRYVEYMDVGNCELIRHAFTLGGRALIACSQRTHTCTA